MFSEASMKNLFVLAILLSSLSAHSAGTIDELIQLSGAKEGYEPCINEMLDPDMMLSKLPESDSPLYALVLEQNQQNEMLIQQYLSWEAVEPGVIRAYTSTYTEEELEYPLRLLQSELGRRDLSKSDKLKQEMDAQLSPILDEFQRKFSELSDSYGNKLDQLIEELEDAEKT